MYMGKDPHIFIVIPFFFSYLFFASSKIGNVGNDDFLAGCPLDEKSDEGIGVSQGKTQWISGP